MRGTILATGLVFAIAALAAWKGPEIVHFGAWMLAEHPLMLFFAGAIIVLSFLSGKTWLGKLRSGIGGAAITLTICIIIVQFQGGPTYNVVEMVAPRCLGVPQVIVFGETQKQLPHGCNWDFDVLSGGIIITGIGNKPPITVMAGERNKVPRGFTMRLVRSIPGTKSIVEGVLRPKG